MSVENPKELRYTKEHEWVRVEDDIATVGITDHAQELMTDIVFVELPEVGKEVSKAKQMCVIESVKSASDVFAPISGKVVGINSELEEHPELINKDAFGKGWLVRIKFEDKKEITNLMKAEEYNKFTK